MKTEPVALLALAAGVVVALAAKLNIVLETSVVETALVELVILFTTVLQRRKVSPVPSP
jgi:hypothetical protein